MTKKSSSRRARDYEAALIKKLTQNGDLSAAKAAALPPYLAEANEFAKNILTGTAVAGHEQLSVETKAELEARELEEKRKAEEAEMLAGTNWDVLHQAYVASLGYLKVPFQIVNDLRNPELAGALVNPALVSKMVMLLNSDVRTLNEEIAAIYAQHKDLTGPVSFEQVTTLASLHDAYSVWVDRCQTLVGPTITELESHIVQALSRLERERKLREDEAKQLNPEQEMEEMLGNVKPLRTVIDVEAQSN